MKAIAGGITGRDHRRAYRDGQDGFALVARPHVTAAIVTDGCSSGHASEVGARLGACFLADLIAEAPELDSADPASAAFAITQRLVERIGAVARSFSKRSRRDDGDDGHIDSTVVGELFLFTFLAAVVTASRAIVFGVGDGVAWIDGRALVIDPGPDNAPLYPAYALLDGGGNSDRNSTAIILPSIHHVGAARDADLIAIATDGAAELLQPECDPSFESVVRDPRLFKNPSLLRKRLIALSDRGLFFDDTTIGLVCRTEVAT